MTNSEYLFENEMTVMLSYFFIFLHIGSKTNIGKKTKNIYFVNYFQIYWSLIIQQWSKFIILNSTDKENEAQRSQ